jgi:hypothetical protein
MDDGKIVVRFSLGARHFFSCPKHPDRLWGPPRLSSKKIGDATPGESSRSEKLTITSSSADVKNMWSYTSTPPYGLTLWGLINPWDNFNVQCSPFYLQISY